MRIRETELHSGIAVVLWKSNTCFNTSGHNTATADTYFLRRSVVPSD